MVREEETGGGGTQTGPGLTAGIVPAEFRQLTGCLSPNTNTTTHINTKTKTKTTGIPRWAGRKSILLVSRMREIDKSLLPRENLA